MGRLKGNDWFGPENKFTPEIEGWCSEFGCGKKLTPMEKMAGEVCAEHSKKKVDRKIKSQFLRDIHTKHK